MSAPDLSISPRRILLIKPSAIGDVVHTLPILNLLRKRFPQAHISWLITPACSDLLLGHPLLDEVILFDRHRFGKGWKNPNSLFGLTSFTADLRRRNFDLVLDLQGLFRSGWLAWQTRAPLRIGFASAREFAPIFYTHRINAGGPEQHAVDRYLRLIQSIGCDIAPVEFPFPSVASDPESSVPAIDRLYAVLLPGTNWPTKRWPAERFAALIAPLKDRFGLESVIAGGPDDVELGKKIGGINLAGKTTLRQLVQLLGRASVVIANDSGPMHIAAALGRPLVALFGPTNPIRTGPYRRFDTVIRLDLECSPCYSRHCAHQSCLQWLTIDPVLTLVEQQLKKLERPNPICDMGILPMQ